MTDTQPNAEAKGEAPAEAKPAQEAGQEAGKAGEAEPPKEMRAVILNGFGGLKSVKIVRRPEPALADGEVLIRVQLWWVPGSGCEAVWAPHHAAPTLLQLIWLLYTHYNTWHPSSPCLTVPSPPNTATPPGLISAYRSWHLHTLTMYDVPPSQCIVFLWLSSPTLSLPRLISS